MKLHVYDDYSKHEVYNIASKTMPTAYLIAYYSHYN
jgi:hypothetical protein